MNESEQDQVHARGCTVPLRMDFLGAAETGLWCDHCLLPSNVRQPTIMTFGSSSWIDTLEICEECGCYGIAGWRSAEGGHHV